MVSEKRNSRSSAAPIARQAGVALLGLLLTLSHGARAQEVGTIAAMEGRAELGRSGAWTAAAVGTAVHQGDELRTGRPGRLRVVFQDDSVITLSEESHVVVDEQVADTTHGQTRSVLQLLQGKLSALVSEYYQRPGAAYEIKTATAVAGVRGTDFIIKYDAADDVTEVVGVSGRVEVHSALDPAARGTFITGRETTTVARGRLPTLPKRLSDALFRQSIEGIEFIGTGGAQSLTEGHTLVAGAAVPQADRAPSSTAAGVKQAEVPGAHRDASGLLQQSPALFQNPEFGPGGKLRVTF